MNLLVDEVVLSLVVKDGVNFLSARSADVRPEHDKIRSIPVHVSRLKVAVEEFDIPSPTVNVLLVLHTELQHERLLLVRELGECRRQRVKVGVLSCFQTYD